VKGPINLRGQIVAVVDLRTCLQLPERPVERDAVHVVVRTTHDPISFLVDEPGGVVEAGEAAFEAPPSTMEGPVLELIKGVYKLPDRLLHILDTRAIVGRIIHISDECFIEE
jgi:purine-binding chemotaxis protein CheW